MIPSKSFDVGNGENHDIFWYFRDFYNTKNPHESHLITISASSTSGGSEYNKSDVSVLISETDNKRWVSEHFPNQSFTINFHKNYVHLIAYALKTQEKKRYINSWDVFGITQGNKSILLDKVINKPLCNNESASCDKETIVPFRCQHPGLFNKFKFVHTGLDSNNELFFSLSQVRFFGSVNGYFEYKTYSHSPLLTSYSVLYVFIFYLK